MIGCATSKNISTNSLSIKNKNCKEIFTKDNVAINGDSSIDLGKNFIRKGYFINGEPINTHIISKDKRIEKKLQYDNYGKIVSYTYYSNKENNENDDYYNIQKYDSIVTEFGKSAEIKKSTYYFNQKNYTVNYIKTKKGINLITNIPDYEISISMTPSIPLNYILQECVNSKLKDTLIINIKSYNITKEQKFILKGQNIVNYEKID